MVGVTPLIDLMGRYSLTFLPEKRPESNYSASEVPPRIPRRPAPLHMAVKRKADSAHDSGHNKGPIGGGDRAFQVTDHTDMMVNLQLPIGRWWQPGLFSVLKLDA